MMFFMFAVFIPCVVFGAFIYMGAVFYKRENSKIIKIRDIEMIVYDKYKTRSSSSNSISRYNYKVILVGIENENKEANLTSKSSYLKYSIGDRVIMQEIIYKYKDEIYSDIVFAKSSHYKREENFKKQYSENSEILDDMYIEECINAYHEDKMRSMNLFKAIFIPIFICFFILTAVEMHKRFKENGYTITIGNRVNVGGVEIVTELDKIEVEGTKPKKSLDDLVDSLPRANIFTDSVETVNLELEKIKSSKRGYDIYIISDNDENTMSYKVNGKVKKFKKEEIPSNYEIRYATGLKKPKIIITKKVINQYDQISNEEFDRLTDEEIKELKPTSVSKEVFYEVVLEEPKQIER